MTGLPIPAFTLLPAAGSARPGNRAVARVAPGLIARLESVRPGEARPWAAVHHARMTIPFGLGVTAALGALGEPDPFQTRWMVRDARIDWHACADDQEELEACATVATVSSRHCRVTVTVKGSQRDHLLDADIRLLPMRDGAYAHAAPSALLLNASSRAQQDGSNESTPAPPVGAGVTLSCDSTALDWLVTPLPGQADPPGRRVHPLGGAPLAAALSAWLALKGVDPYVTPCSALPSMEAVWLAPLPLGTPFAATARPSGIGFPIEVFTTSGRTALRARVLPQG